MAHIEVKSELAKMFEDFVRKTQWEAIRTERSRIIEALREVANTHREVVGHGEFVEVTVIHLEDALDIVNNVTEKDP